MNILDNEKDSQIYFLTLLIAVFNVDVSHQVRDAKSDFQIVRNIATKNFMGEHDLAVAVTKQVEFYVKTETCKKIHGTFL